MRKFITMIMLMLAAVFVNADPVIPAPAGLPVLKTDSSASIAHSGTYMSKEDKATMDTGRRVNLKCYAVFYKIGPKKAVTDAEFKVMCARSAASFTSPDIKQANTKEAADRLLTDAGIKALDYRAASLGKLFGGPTYECWLMLNPEKTGKTITVLWMASTIINIKGEVYVLTYHMSSDNHPDKETITKAAEEWVEATVRANQ